MVELLSLLLAVRMVGFEKSVGNPRFGTHVTLLVLHAQRREPLNHFSASQGVLDKSGAEMFSKRVRVAGIGVGLAVLSATLVATPVQAQEGPDDPIEVVEEALTKRPVLQAEESEKPVVRVTGGELIATATVPGDGSTAVALSRQNADGSTERSDSGSRVGVDLGRNGVVVEGTEDGIRLMEVIEDPKADHEFAYQMTVEGQDAKFKMAPDGSVLVGYGDVEAGQFEPVGSIDAPWALDASNQPVPVSYTISPDGIELGMRVSKMDEHAYPIVADPSYHTTWYGLHTIKLNPSETQDLLSLLKDGRNAAAVGTAICATATAGLCAVVGSLGTIVIQLGYHAITICKNDKGVDLHSYSIVGGIWCSGY